MRNRKTFNKEHITNIFVLIIFAIGIFFIWHKISSSKTLGSAPLFMSLFILCCLTYLILLIDTIHFFRMNNLLERYDPSNQDIIERLKSERRFFLTPQLRQKIKHWNQEKNMIQKSLVASGYRKIAENDAGVIFNKKNLVRTTDKRIFIIEKHLLNVLIVEQIIQDCLHFNIMNKDMVARFNQIIIITDMNNNDEICSAAAGVLNYFGRHNEKSEMGILLVDKSFGRMFFQLDKSVQSFRQRVFQMRIKRLIMKLIKSI